MRRQKAKVKSQKSKGWNFSFLFLPFAFCLLPFALTSPHSATPSPLIFWSQGIETAPALKQAGIEQVCVQPEKAAEWQRAGFKTVSMSLAELERREKLLVPRIVGRSGVASPTRRPWVDANGWRFIRKPDAKFYYDLPQGKAALSLAETFVYGADAVLKIAPGDVDESGRMLAFLRQLPKSDLPLIAELSVVDDGSAQIGEVMNLLSRRNLLFRVSPEPSPNYPVNIKLGTREYPETEAADPSAFVQKIRLKIGDENRRVRIYGSEVIVSRLSGDDSRVRLHLINYGGSQPEWIRVRLRGTYEKGDARVFGFGNVSLEEFVAADGATEFSIPKMGVYAVIDLN